MSKKPHHDFEVKIWRDGTLRSTIDVCGENVNINDLIHTLIAFDQAVRLKNKGDD